MHIINNRITNIAPPTAPPITAAVEELLEALGIVPAILKTIKSINRELNRL